MSRARRADAPGGVCCLRCRRICRGALGLWEHQRRKHALPISITQILGAPRDPCPRCNFDRQAKPQRWKRQAARVAFLRRRDGSACYICAEPIVFEGVAWNHEAAVSVDHVVPASHGGCSCPSNLRIAHRYCNMKRSDDPPGTKLRLRGCGGHMRKVLSQLTALGETA